MQNRRKIKRKGITHEGLVKSAWGLAGDVLHRWVVMVHGKLEHETVWHVLLCCVQARLLLMQKWTGYSSVQGAYRFRGKGRDCVLCRTWGNSRRVGYGLFMHVGNRLLHGAPGLAAGRQGHSSCMVDGGPRSWWSKLHGLMMG